jgi:hypothetical protein
LRHLRRSDPYIHPIKSMIWQSTSNRRLSSESQA